MSSARTAFVLSGGGSLGAVQAGMLQALVEHGVTPAFVIGTSAGAINAVHFAADPMPEGVERLARVWLRIGRADIFPLSVSQGTLALLGKRDSLFNPAALRATLEGALQVRRIEDTTIPCHIMTTDLRSGAEVVLSSGPVIDALLASAAIPGLLPPHRVGDRLLTDGGIAANAPISAAIALGADRVIVLPTGFPCAVRTEPHGLGQLLLHTFSLFVARQMVSDITRLQGEVAIRIVPPLCPLRVSPHDFSKAATLIASAAAQTRDWLDKEGLERSQIPESLPPHTHPELLEETRLEGADAVHAGRLRADG
jgi:NTE family protein